jgi:hypothetical protein
VVPVVLYTSCLLQERASAVTMVRKIIIVLARMWTSLSIYLSGFITAVTVFWKPNAIPPLTSLIRILVCYGLNVTLSLLPTFPVCQSKTLLKTLL